MSVIDIVRDHVTSGRLPSAVLGIADAAGVQELVAVGARTDDRYPLFSITKPIVAVTAARLIEQGLLSADTTLATALPGFANKSTTLAHLASHTSGLDEPALDTAVPLRRELLTRGQIFSPGSAVQYSTLAYTGIAALIENAGGRGWEAEVDDLFASLGSPHAVSTDLADALPVADAAAAGHDMAVFAAQRNPGAGLAGRAEDLLRLGSALLRIAAGGRREFLTPAALDAMRTPRTTGLPRADPGSPTADREWGLGWHVAPAGFGDATVFGHGGWAGTEFWVHPAVGRAWVLLTNRAVREGVDPATIGRAVGAGR
ncbi:MULTISPECIES: serine hydrolase [Microbacterium]|uniref:serine hydrolase domain-containing protein n=1 Tax=Microbacterium TaxID=33882 RepID=UPI001E55B9A4|nr:serine hydrolase domain-containing protein [Microbacterium nymphoidis]MCD2497931.1 beta-lactamase family protein [Microbacterium nymphoidis]